MSFCPNFKFLSRVEGASVHLFILVDTLPTELVCHCFAVADGCRKRKSYRYVTKNTYFLKSSSDRKYIQYFDHCDFSKARPKLLQYIFALPSVRFVWKLVQCIWLAKIVAVTETPEVCIFSLIANKNINCYKVPSPIKKKKYIYRLSLS